MKSKAGKILYYVIVLVLLISFLAKFGGVAQIIANVFGTTPEAVQDIANVTFYIALGAFLIVSGILALAIPLVAVVLIGVGLGMIAMGIYNKVKTPILSNTNDL